MWYIDSCRRDETGNTKGGSIIVPLTGLVSAAWQLKLCFYLQNRLIQTGKTGGQRYTDTPPFSIPSMKSQVISRESYHGINAFQQMLFSFVQVDIRN